MEGGFAALATRKTGGRSPRLTSAQQTHAVKLRKQGASVRSVAVTLGVSLGVVGRVLKGIRPVAQGAVVPAQDATPPELPGMTVAAWCGTTVLGSQEIAATTTDTRSEEDSTTADTRTEEVASVPTEESVISTPTADRADSTASEDASPSLPNEAPEGTEAELAPGAPLQPSAQAHACRYAGTLLVCAAVHVLGLRAAMERAAVTRPASAVYSARQALLALCAAWAAGLPSLEAMHERDARALGVVLGLERSPSVRTLHRALKQMTEEYDPVQWTAGWMHALARVQPPETPIFGVDGHIKSYTGTEPIDKGWDTKKRMPVRALAVIRVTDLDGLTWIDLHVPAGDGLRKHLMEAAVALREACRHVVTTPDVAHAETVPEPQPERPIVLAFDRGGFDFDVFDALDAEHFWYLAWVPASVRLPDLALIAPANDGVGDTLWDHPRLGHPCRLLVQRDGDALVPAATNLPPFIDATAAMQHLRDARGMEENVFKAARRFAHIDRLEDRGGATRRPDDRLVDNPERVRLKGVLKELNQVEGQLARERPVRGIRKLADINADLDINEHERRIVKARIKEQPTRVPRHTVDPDAERATLKTRNRLLLGPVKNATENARRWLLAKLATGLSPSDHAWDLETNARTLDALIKAPGIVRITTDRCARESLGVEEAMT